MEVSPSKGFSHLYNDLNAQGLTQLSNPVVLVMIFMILIFYLFIFNYLGVSYNPQEVSQQTASNLGGIEIIMWGLFVFLILINGVQYFFGIEKVDVVSADQMALDYEKSIKDAEKQIENIS